MLPHDPTLQFFSTILICGGAWFTGLTLPQAGIEIDVYRYGAFTMLFTLAIAFTVEALAGVRSLIRVDIVALVALYFLTFAEFLHPQVRILYQGYTGNAALSVQLVLIGTACLAIGRHLPAPLGLRPDRTSLPELSSSAVFKAFVACFVLGYLWVVISVDANPFTLFDGMLAERFNRPWQRAQVGGWISALTELNLLLYPAFAIGGYIMARGREFPAWQRAIVLLVLLFGFAFDVAEGARNVVLIRAAMFLATYFIAAPNRKGNLRVIVLGSAAMIGLWYLSAFMIEFRAMGLRLYMTHGSEIIVATLVRDHAATTFMLDNNLVSIARVCQVYPELYPFPGSDIVVQIFTKWVPRALWPDKPVAWTHSIEDVLGVSGLTIAVTFVGEAYLIAGIPSLVFVSLMMGSLAGGWNRVGVGTRTNMDLVYYASGFFAAMLAIRSVQWLSVTFLPTIIIYLFGQWLKSGPHPKLLRYLT